MIDYRDSWKSDDGKVRVSYPVDEATGEPEFDEAFFTDVQSVHLEMMRDSHLWGCVTLNDGRRFRIGIGTKSKRGKLIGFVEPD